VNKRLPAEAFAYYLSLGADRGYAAVAKHFGVSKRTVTTAASRERWQERVAQAEAKVRDEAQQQYVDAVRQMNEQHLKVLQFVMSRGVEGLKKAPVSSFADALRAVNLAIEKERLIRGEPTDRTENVEALVKRETERFLTTAKSDDWSRFEGEDGDEKGEVSDG
jgi:recombinational DNA repair ATPase RecF